MKFFVYHGYVTPDNCDASEGDGPYRLDVCTTEAQVLKLRAEHEDRSDEASGPVFRVIEGEEIAMKPMKTVETWKLHRK